MTRNEPERVGDILSRLKQTTGLGKQLDHAQVWEHWPHVAGHDLWRYGHPYRIRGNTLYIEVESAVWMHKFAYHERDIVARVNRMVGYGLIAGIFVTLKPDADPFPSQHGA